MAVPGAEVLLYPAAPMPDAAPLTNATLAESRPMANLRGPQDSWQRPEVAMTAICPQQQRLR